MATAVLPAHPQPVSGLLGSRVEDKLGAGLPSETSLPAEPQLTGMAAALESAPPGALRPLLQESAWRGESGPCGGVGPGLLYDLPLPESPLFLHSVRTRPFLTCEESRCQETCDSWREVAVSRWKQPVCPSAPARLHRLCCCPFPRSLRLLVSFCPGWRCSFFLWQPASPFPGATLKSSDTRGRSEDRT